MHQKVDQLEDLLFPVRRVPIYADLRGGANDGLQRIPGKRAIVNCATDQAISIVSESYQVVTNREALHYAQLCCQAAFPESGTKEWRILQAHAPTTRGSCRIDLVHPASALDFEGIGANEQPDSYGPFIRVTNSYNRSRALGFEIGFIRWVCENGMIIPDSRIGFAFNHSTRKIPERVKFEVKKDRFKRLKQRFQDFLAPLRECSVPLHLFVPTTRAVLRIDKPEPLTRYQQEPWEQLSADLQSISDDYANRLGQNGYALLNVITDVASRPPGSQFVRREQHNLQKSAGNWLKDFSAECRKTNFSLTAHVDRLRAEQDSRRVDGQVSQTREVDHSLRS